MFGPSAPGDGQCGTFPVIRGCCLLSLGLYSSAFNSLALCVISAPSLLLYPLPVLISAPSPVLEVSAAELAPDPAAVVTFFFLTIPALSTQDQKQQTEDDSK